MGTEKGGCPPAMVNQIDERKIKFLENNEKLGRDERSKTGAEFSFRRLRDGGEAKVRASLFVPPKHTNEISVNRLDLASEKTLAEIGERNANLIDKKFWGWYTLTASDVKESGCSVKPTPSNDNPYHADILVPVTPDAEGSKDDFREYAKVLAYRAKFVPWGNWKNEIT